MKNFTIRLILFIAGLFTLAFGASLVIEAELGAATWDVLHIGMADLTGLSIGRWVQIVGGLMLVTTALLERRKIALGSILNIFLMGFFINFILGSDMVPNFSNTSLNFIMLILGSVLIGTGSGMYTSTRVGPGPRDGMTLYISDRFSLSVRVSRTILEITALTLGWIAGGPVSFGTFIILIIIGPVMQTSLNFFRKIVHKIK